MVYSDLGTQILICYSSLYIDINNKETEVPYEQYSLYSIGLPYLYKHFPAAPFHHIFFLFTLFSSIKLL